MLKHFRKIKRNIAILKTAWSRSLRLHESKWHQQFLQQFKIQILRPIYRGTFWLPLVLSYGSVIFKNALLRPMLNKKVRIWKLVTKFDKIGIPGSLFGPFYATCQHNRCWTVFDRNLCACVSFFFFANKATPGEGKIWLTLCVSRSCVIVTQTSRRQ